MAYEGGFQIGKEIGAINIPSMDKQLDLYTKMNVARSVNEQRQKAAREKRVNDVIDEQRKENAEFIYEDKIDDIGLEKPDQAAAKFQQVLKNSYERDTFAFQKGALSEKDYTANNSRRKASVKQVMGIYKKAGDFIDEHKGLVESGKNNFLNDFKAEIIGNHMKHIAFSNKLDGTTEVQTINEKGQVTNMLSSTLESIATTEAGLRPDSIVNKLVSEAGFIKYDSASGRYRFTDYASGKNKERTQRLLDAAFEGYTDGQYMDLLNNLGGVSTNAEDAKREGLIHIDANNFLRKSPEEIQEIKKAARDKMTQYFNDRLELKQQRNITPSKPGTGTPKYRNRGDGFFILNQKTPLQFKDMEGVMELDMESNNQIGEKDKDGNLLPISHEKGFIEAVRFHPKDKNKKLVDKRMYAEIIVPDDTGQKGNFSYSTDENGNPVFTIGGSEVSYTRKRVLLDPKDQNQASQILNISSYFGIQKKEMPKPYAF